VFSDEKKADAVTLLVL